MRLPTVKMYKGSRTIIVNETDTLRFAADGWSRGDKSTKPTGQSKSVVQPVAEVDVDEDIVLGDDAE